MSEWGGPCTTCGHPASYHGATFCQVRAGAASKRDCDCTGYAFPADVPMSPNTGHDLRERIAQRIDQAWAEANDQRPRSEYRDGYIDGLEHAEAAARSTPLTMGGAS